MSSSETPFFQVLWKSTLCPGVEHKVCNSCVSASLKQLKLPTKQKNSTQTSPGFPSGKVTQDWVETEATEL